MRTKFEKPRVPSEKEMKFIKTMESLYVGINPATLKHMLNVSERELRWYQERYNTSKYIGIIPLGRIINKKGLYRLIKPETAEGDKLRKKIFFNKLCALIDDKQAEITLGPLQLNGQINMYDLLNMSLAELMELANQIDQDINNN